MVRPVISGVAGCSCGEHNRRFGQGCVNYGLREWRFVAGQERKV